MHHSPAADRNKQPILDVLKGALPSSGTVLEIASGSGQHVLHFARALPALSWQPSDPSPEARASITAQIDGASPGDVRPPLALDVMERQWPALPPICAVLCINMVHISPWEATVGLMAHAARLLPSGGLLYLYGPFRRDGAHTAPSNAAFDADLRARNPAWGVRDLETVSAEAAACGFGPPVIVSMPANNLSVLLRRR